MKIAGNGDSQTCKNIFSWVKNLYSQIRFPRYTNSRSFVNSSRLLSAVEFANA